MSTEQPPDEADVIAQRIHDQAVWVVSEIIDHAIAVGSAPEQQFVGSLTVLARGHGWQASQADIRALWQTRQSIAPNWHVTPATIDEPQQITGGVAVLSLGAFLAVERPELRYWIPGLLPDRGKLLLTATAKAGKTFWALNMAFALANGNCRWLGLEFGEPATVLMLQPELSDGLMASRLRWIAATAPPWAEFDTIRINLHIWQCDVCRPVLRGKNAVAVEDEIEALAPDVVIVDPLYATFPGLVENAADEMSQALDIFTGWTQRFGCAVILTHHHSKLGSSRGSSVLQGWPETDLSMRFDGENHSRVVVDGLFRCSFADDWPQVWRTPNRDTGWFEMDAGGDRRTGRPPSIEIAEVVEVLSAGPSQGMTAREFYDAVAAAFNVSDKTARRRINATRDAGLISYENGFFRATS